MVADVMESGQRHFLADVLRFEGLKWSNSAEVVQIVGPMMEIVKDQLQRVAGFDAEGGPVRDQVAVLIDFAENDARQKVAQAGRIHRTTDRYR